MHHSYKRYEQDETWSIVNKLRKDLLDNNDIELLTPIEYATGYTCNGLIDSR